MILINFKPYKSSISDRIEYLLSKNGKRDKSKVEVLEGNNEIFQELSKQVEYERKAFLFLISFKESRQELEEKLKKQGKKIEDIYREIRDLLMAGYQDDEVSILSVAHSDTDHFHIHTTILSKNLKTNTQLYFPKNDVGYFKAIQEYISYKYNISLDTSPKPTLKKVNSENIKGNLIERGEYKNLKKDEIKEMIINLLTKKIREGEIDNRDELINYLRGKSGIELNRIGKNYISIKFNGIKVRFKGGIFDEEKFSEYRDYILNDGYYYVDNIEKKLQKAEEKLEKLKQKRIAIINERFKKYRKADRSQEKEEVLKVEIDSETKINTKKEAIIFTDFQSSLQEKVKEIDDEKALINEIKQKLNLHLLLKYVNKHYGFDISKYEINAADNRIKIKGKKGKGKNAIDFLVKEVKLKLNEAFDIAKTLYQQQRQQQEPEKQTEKEKENEVIKINIHSKNKGYYKDR